MRSPLRWVLVSAFAVNMFCNHWSRDSLGALEVPLETGYMNLTVAEYNALSSAYFFPNVIVPLLAGAVAQLDRGARQGPHSAKSRSRRERDLIAECGPSGLL